MAGPTVRCYRHIVVAFVAEFLLVRMAVHAGILKTHIYALSGTIYINPVSVTDDRIPPVIQQLHMLRPHKILGLNTLLDLHLVDDRGVYARFRLCTGLSDIVDERKGHKRYKYKKSGNDLTAVVHC